MAYFAPPFGSATAYVLKQPVRRRLFARPSVLPPNGDCARCRSTFDYFYLT
jgi:hypothetical protein